MKAVNNNTYEQVYNVREDENITSHVVKTICILEQRGLLIAGFSQADELLTMHYTGYNKNRPVWELDFFEHIFNHGSLLADKDKIKGVFICSHKQLIVPHELFDEYEAPGWLKSIHFIEPKDVIESYVLESDKACYVQAAPLSIAQLVKINFKKTGILPLAFYHFKGEHNVSLQMQCCLTNDQAIVTLHNYSQLLWHQVFDYTSAEDIAYNINHYCRENNMNPATLNICCNAVTGAEYDIINSLTQYFNGIKAGDGQEITGRWAPAISLANQLLSCV